MTEHYFNPLEYAHQLEAVGVPSAQAEIQAKTLAQYLEGSSATKNELFYRMSELDQRSRDEFKQAMATLNADMSARIDQVERRLNWITIILVTTQLGLFGMVAGLYLR